MRPDWHYQEEAAAVDAVAGAGHAEHAGHGRAHHRGHVLPGADGVGDAAHLGPCRPVSEPLLLDGRLLLLQELARAGTPRTRHARGDEDPSDGRNVKPFLPVLVTHLSSVLSPFLSLHLSHSLFLFHTCCTSLRLLRSSLLQPNAFSFPKPFSVLLFSKNLVWGLLFSLDTHTQTHKQMHTDSHAERTSVELDEPKPEQTPRAILFPRNLTVPTKKETDKQRNKQNDLYPKDTSRPTLHPR